MSNDAEKNNYFISITRGSNKNDGEANNSTADTFNLLLLFALDFYFLLDSTRYWYTYDSIQLKLRMGRIFDLCSGFAYPAGVRILFKYMKYQIRTLFVSPSGYN